MLSQKNNDYQKEYYQKNRERKLKYFKGKYAEDPQKYIGRTTKYHTTHPDVATRASKKKENINSLERAILYLKGNL